MIITIDGPASAGKGTLASTLAEIYHLAYFDTGMIFGSRIRILMMRTSPKRRPGHLLLQK